MFMNDFVTTETTRILCITSHKSLVNGKAFGAIMFEKGFGMKLWIGKQVYCNYHYVRMDLNNLVHLRELSTRNHCLFKLVMLLILIGGVT